MEYRYLFQFYFICLFLNIIALPLCSVMFKKFKDGGAIIGKTFGIYISGYIVWLLSSLHILKFTYLSCVIGILLTGIGMYASVIYKVIKKKECAFISYIKEHWKSMVLGELAFLVFFILINILFAFKVPATDTERMMDLGFMNSIFKTEYMPPLDMWAAGEYINYYYFGQYIITYLTKACLIPVEYGYTFGLVAIAAFALVAVFRLVQNITGSRIAGLMSSVAVVFAGNFQYVIFYKLVPMIWDILQLEGEKPSYWFADSTRYIGYTPEVSNDKTIHEFPAYSFIVGDLHAHVVNIFVVLAILTILWSYLSEVKERLKKDTGLIEACITPHFLVIGFLIGISSMSNYWDFPIYYVVSGSIILFGMISAIGVCKKLPFFIAIDGMLILLINMLVSLPFNIKFVKMVQGIGIVERRSLIHQLIILWGFPFVMAMIFMFIVVKYKKFTQKSLYITLLSLCAMGLALVPEFVFVKDIYIDAYPRANTMFKLTYQAFILFGICMGCYIYEIYKHSKSLEGFASYNYKKIAIIAIICLFFTSTYFYAAEKMWIGTLTADKYDGFDASVTIVKNNSEEMAAIEFLEQYVEQTDEKQPVVLEADGDSYTNTCKVSVLTGYPTVLGWHTHEWLWHNSHSYMEVRRIDVENFYTSEDMNEKQSIINKYGIDYIYIGLKEYEKYEVVQNGLLEELGEVIYCEAVSDGSIVEIIRINK